MSSPNPVAPAGIAVRELTINPYSVEPGRCVVAVAGEVDLASAPQLKAALSELCELGYAQFVLDLSDVVHIDSTGLGVLVAFQNRLEHSGRLILAAVPANVASLLSMLGLDTRMPSFPTVKAALAETGGDSDQSAFPVELRGAAGSSRDEVVTGHEPAEVSGPPIGDDARLVLGLASTALPFADSVLAEAERWLRILARYGEAGRILRGTGVKEAPFADVAAAVAHQSRGTAATRPEDRLAAATEQARNGARARKHGEVGTLDVLRAVAAVYGEDFDRVVAAYDGDVKTLHSQRLLDT